MKAAGPAGKLTGFKIQHGIQKSGTNQVTKQVVEMRQLIANTGAYGS